MTSTSSPFCPAPPPTSSERPDRNLALELVRVTEAAAMAAGRWVGRGDKNSADGAAVEAMRHLISSISMNGVVVIGEGEKDNAPMLYNGEQVGDGTGPEVDVAVDPVDGTTLTAKGMSNAVSVLAVAERGTMYDPSAVFYMDKLATGPDAADVVDIRLPVRENIRRVAKAKNERPSDVTVVMLDRPRHTGLAQEIRDAGARLYYISDGDVAGAVMAARPGTGVDLMLGVGGTPEGIIAACAIKCMGGVIQGRLAPTDDDERQKALDAGLDLDARPLDRGPGQRRVLLRRERDHRRPAAPRGPLRLRRRHHPFARHAVAQRHDPHHRGAAPVPQAQRVRPPRLRPPRLGPVTR